MFTCMFVHVHSSTFPLFAYALFGSSRQLAVGPTAIASLLTNQTVSAIIEDTSDPRYYALATAMAFLSGILQLILGFLQLGFFVDFLAHPVISGFTSAAAIIIGFSQLKHVLGVRDRKFYI